MLSSEGDSTLFKAGLQAVAANPLPYLSTVSTQLLFFWWRGSQSWTTLFNVVTQTPLLILGIAGLILACKDRRDILPLLLIVAYFNLLHALLHARARYSFPVMPYVMTLGAYAAIWIHGMWEERRRRLHTA